ncbi:hypothetical protein [Chamaesiphon minutus]|nr:hypothetical protein [Chamaesiphon minutus]
MGVKTGQRAGKIGWTIVDSPRERLRQRHPCGRANLTLLPPPRYDR